MITPVKLFQPEQGLTTDFTKYSPGEIFNQSAINRFNSMESQYGTEDLLPRKEMTPTIYETPESDPFFSQLRKPSLNLQSEVTNYDSEIEPTQAAPETPQQTTPVNTEGNLNLKLSNYGYASDSSPDYNSNVRKVGHAENRLEDGVSAALTKSLAQRYNLKTGDMFEAVTADGKVLTRRYDDTVPASYRGRALPETIDLYEISGKNSFGGKITQLRKL